jgi:dGTPase
LEAQLIDLADEVAYNTADLDDGFSAGMVVAEDIAAAVPRYGEILESVNTQFPGATSRERFYEGLRQLIDTLVSGLIEGTTSEAREAGAATPDDVRTCARRLASFTPDTAEVGRQLRRFLHARVYEAPALLAGRGESAVLVGELFQFFLERPEQLPEAYQEQAANEPLHRVVCDYIGGMTDVYCRRIHESRARLMRL